MITDKRFKNWRQVQAYKHDGHLHREWSPAFLVDETDEYWALASRMSAVVESDGRRWMTKEPAIFLLFKKKWMNVIAMFKENGGICYYVNVATPTIDDKGYLKYIDYDLDVKLYPDLVEKTLDEREFAHNAEFYGYSKELVAKIKESKDNILKMIDNRDFPFVDEEMQKRYQMFLDANQPIEKNAH
jgi:protein associated with RNAse G/E